MYEWIYAVQHLIDWIDTHVIEKPTLMEISRQVGYSPYYCSEQFHHVAGMTIKAYVSKRRLSMAAVAIRDSDRSLFLPKRLCFCLLIITVKERWI